MLVARNRRFRIAASLAAVSVALLAARYGVEAANLHHYSVATGYVVSTVLFVVANLVGALGWVVVARSFGAEIPWRRLRFGAATIVFAYFGLYVGEVLRVILVLDHSHDGDYRGIYIAAAISGLLFLVGMVVIVTGLTDARRGASRTRRIWLGSSAVTAAYVAGTIGQLFQQSFYSSYDTLPGLATGSLTMAVGSLGLALAALVFTVGARRPRARREASLTAAAVGAVLASICVGGGEVVITLTLSNRGDDPAWVATSLWFGLASRFLAAAAFAAVALGARGGAANSTTVTANA